MKGKKKMNIKVKGKYNNYKILILLLIYEL